MPSAASFVRALTISIGARFGWRGCPGRRMWRSRSRLRHERHVAPRTMRGQLSLNLFSATVLALGAGYYAIFAIQISGIYSSNWTDADLIRDRCPFRLIQPEWVSSQPDTVLNWLGAEIKARLSLILM